MTDVTRDAVREAIVADALEHYNWFEDREPKADEVGIQDVAGGLRVYSTDERAAVMYDRVHSDEVTALSDFLRKLRATNRYLASVAQRRYERAHGGTPEV